MAITVKDIQEKEFSTQAAEGYNVEQVDDFLDEIAVDLNALILEKNALAEQVNKLNCELAAAKAENAELAKKLPDYNEEGYFKNLEKSLREALIGAQRIADETVAEADKKAQQTIDDANAQAEKTVAEADANAKTITEDAEKVVAALSEKAAQLRATADAYRANFKKLVEDQMNALTAGSELLK